MHKRSAVVWDESLLGYDLGGDHPLHPIRLDLTIRLATELGILEDVDLVRPELAEPTDLERVHTNEYINAVRSAPGVGRSVGYGLGTVDTPVFERMHESAALVAGASVGAADRIASGHADRAVNLAGGLHHAMPGHAAGFCVYNDCSVAIAWMLARGVERIAYLDIDVHHGDGVQAAFYDDPRVLTISLHQHPRTLWPGTGFASELGQQRSRGSAVNVPLPPGTDDAGWQRAFHAVVPSLLGSFRPQVLVTQCGADTHQEDPLADVAMTVDGHRSIYRTLRDLANEHAGGKWLVLGGGGYALYRVVPRSWTHLLATVLDREVPANTTIPPGWMSHTAKLAGNAAIPVSMGDGCDAGFEPWDGTNGSPLDQAIDDTRRAAFPLHGLDPHDRRD